MAPLSGLENRALAPLWIRIGAMVYHHGEHFYNFQGLRLYKEKFDPLWVPKYLASPGGIALPRVLANVAALIAGGVKGIVGSKALPIYVECGGLPPLETATSQINA